MDTKEYFKNNIIGADIFDNKYSHVKEDGTKENVTEVFGRVAKGLAVYERDPLFWETSWETDMMDGWYRPGGSIISGVGNSSMVSLANCTTIPLKGDSLKDIIECMSDMMHCAARRQGLGTDVSKLRPTGAKVNNSANESTGAVPWMDFLDSMGNYVGQAGRRPAILLSLKVHHPDIFSFCASKEELDKIQNANISVQITKDFMEAVERDDDWQLVFETHHEKIEKTVKAKELFSLIAKKACDTAEPGVQFIDDMRNGSMIHQIYKATGDPKFKIISTNACVSGNEVVYVLVDGKSNIMQVKDVVRLFENSSADIQILSHDTTTKKDEYQSVVFAGKTRENAELIEIMDEETGKFIICTPDHEVFTKNRGYVQAIELKEDDVLMIM